MTKQVDGAEERKGPKIQIFWMPVLILVALAIATTSKGLVSMFGELYVAIGFAIVIQWILLQVSFSLGGELARLVTGRRSEHATTPGERRARVASLTIIYLLFFGLSFFMALSTYYNIIRSQGDDLEITATQAIQLSDTVLPGLRSSVDEKVSSSQQQLKDSEQLRSYFAQIAELTEVAGRPETAEKTKSFAFQASQQAFQDRQRERTSWSEERTRLISERSKRADDLKTSSEELNRLKKELADSPDRLRQFGQAIDEELTVPVGLQLPPSLAPARRPSPPPVPLLAADSLASRLLPGDRVREGAYCGHGTM